MEMNNKVRLRNRSHPSLIWLAVPWKSWEKKTWDRVREVQITPKFSTRNNQEIMKGVEKHLIQKAVSTIRTYLPHEPKVRKLDRSSVEQVRSYDDLTQFLDETFSLVNPDNLPSEPNLETRESLSKLREFYDLHPIEGDVKLVRGDCENPDMTIISTEDRMPSDTGVYKPETRPSVNLCRCLRKQVKESDVSWSQANDIKNAIGDLRHAQQLKNRDVHLVIGGLSEVETGFFPIFQR